MGKSNYWEIDFEIGNGAFCFIFWTCLFIRIITTSVPSSFNALARFSTMTTIRYHGATASASLHVYLTFHLVASIKYLPDKLHDLFLIPHRLRQTRELVKPMW